MVDKAAQAGLFAVGLLGLSGGIRGLNDGDATMVGMSLFPAFLSFCGLLVMYYLSYKNLEK